MFYMALEKPAEKNLKTAMQEALLIQDGFVAEPLFATTGKGHLNSEGVAQLKKLKSNSKIRTTNHSK